MMKFFNPFGPYILQSNIDEESRIAALELIHKLDEDIKAGIIEAGKNIIRVGGTQTEDAEQYDCNIYHDTYKDKCSVHSLESG